MTNAEKARELCKLYQTNRASLFQHLLAMAEWKDKQYEAEREDLRGLVNMLQIDDRNQTIIEDLKGLLSRMKEE